MALRRPFKQLGVFFRLVRSGELHILRVSNLDPVRKGVEHPIQSLQKLFLAASEKFNIKAGSIADIVSSLSGGNQQKVVIARSLSTEPLVILPDDPTRGIDVGAKSENHHILNQLTARGCGIIMVSSELPEVLAMSDRLIVMYKGQVRAQLGHEGVDHEFVVRLATGADGLGGRRRESVPLLAWR